MPLLSDQTWKTKYTPDDGDLVQLFYVPALEAAVRYDRTTGYFSASALAIAARGLEGLIRNDGRMRLIVGLAFGGRVRRRRAPAPVGERRIPLFQPGR